MPREKTLLTHLDPNWQRAVENVRQAATFASRPPSHPGFTTNSAWHKMLAAIVSGADDATKHWSWSSGESLCQN
jgi:hypothetical protein